MKVILIAEHKKALQACRAGIVAEVESLGPALKKLATATRERAQLAAEVDTLEREEDATAEAVNALMTKRGQLELVGRKVDRLAQDATPMTEGLRRLLHNAAQTIHQAFSPVFESYVEEIAESFAPFYSDLKNALAIARQTDAAAMFGIFITPRYGQRTDALGESSDVLALIDSMLAGKVDWEFCGGK